MNCPPRACVKAHARLASWRRHAQLGVARRAWSAKVIPLLGVGLAMQAGLPPPGSSE